MSDRLLLDFEAFFLEHRLCGDLGGDGAQVDDLLARLDQLERRRM